MGKIIEDLYESKYEAARKGKDKILEFMKNLL